MGRLLETIYKRNKILKFQKEFPQGVLFYLSLSEPKQPRTLHVHPESKYQILITPTPTNLTSKNTFIYLFTMN